MSTSSHWFVYMILTSDQQLYTGITTNIVRRWHQHHTGKTGARYFRSRSPIELCFLEGHVDRSSASKREYALKVLKRVEKRALIRNFLPNTLATFADCELDALPIISSDSLFWTTV